MLAGKLALGDIDDVEAYLDRAVTNALRRRQAYLRREEREELLADLFEKTWRMWVEHDDARARFSSRVYSAVSFAVADQQRAALGRGKHPRPTLVPLDGGDENDDDRRRLELGDAFGASSNGGADRHFDLGRILDRRAVAGLRDLFAAPEPGSREAPP